MDCCARLSGGARDRAGGQCRLAMSVAGRIETGAPTAGQLRDQFSDLCAVQKSRIEAHLARDVKSVGDSLFILGGSDG